MATPFTKDLAENIHKAWEANKKEVDNVYHHPTTNGTVKKCIDLSCNKPLTKVHTSENKPKSNSPERWLEAYIIQLAKQSNNYKEPFELVDKEHNLVAVTELNCRFLYSQLKFRRTEDSGARPLDCLLYEPATHHLIIAELKATREERSKAIEELDYYAEKIYGNKDELAKIFPFIDNVIDVEGYIVWPENKRNANIELNFGGWGLIEYSDKHGMIKHGKLVKPWEQCNQNQIIEFVKVKESKVIK